MWTSSVRTDVLNEYKKNFLHHRGRPPRRVQLIRMRPSSPVRIWRNCKNSKSLLCIFTLFVHECVQYIRDQSSTDSTAPPLHPNSTPTPPKQREAPWPLAILALFPCFLDFFRKENSTVTPPQLHPNSTVGRFFENSRRKANLEDGPQSSSLKREERTAGFSTLEADCPVPVMYLRTNTSSPSALIRLMRRVDTGERQRRERGLRTE